MAVTELPATESGAPSTGRPVLRAVGVTKEYGEGSAARRALDDIDLDISVGRFVAIVGPSGSGKSTLLHLFGALDTPTAGEVWFEDRCVNQADESARTEMRRSRLGFVFQQYNLLPVLNATDNVALPLVITRVPESVRRARVDQALELVGLPASVRAQRPAQLSGGEQQRIAIARALVTDPAVILADEPTGALDTDNGRAILGVLRDICDRDHRTIVLATHDPVASAMADEVVRLRDGRIVDRHLVERVPLDTVFRDTATPDER